MPAQSYMEVTGEPLTTLKHTCDDTVETLIDDVTGFLAQSTVTRGYPQTVNVVGCLITVEDFSIRFTWGADATQAGLGHVIAPGQSLKLTSHKQIIDFRFINKDSGDDAILQITPELAIP